MTLEEIEKLRKKAALLSFLGVLVGTIVGVLLAYIIFFYSSSGLIVAVGVGVFSAIGLSWLISFAPKRNFKSAFKEKYVLAEFEKRFQNVNYNPEQGIPEGVIADTAMINMGTNYESNDFLAAEYKEVKFVQADITIKEKRYVEVNDIPVRVKNKKIFRGRWMIFDFNKSFKADIQVRQNKFANARVEKIKNPVLKFKKIEMENVEFNKKFKVFAQSEHDAFYVLTPRMMERIESLVESADGKFLFCFLDNRLHIAFNNNKDSFEHKVFKKIVEEKVQEEVFKDTELIMNFINELNLDNDLFRKEV